ncbi:MAG: hypothetical protein M1834_008870 [Cirrosporium novae-zelandiae]|nr:MAG: hypothetical protein M1834_008870 [Cirrosporium novae-zelandiae]
MVEARSLSTLTSLASNPPRYPRNPTEPHESLTLYIARVPGSRDVFLSTLKPRQKVVTAEDVQNSFYFLHVNTAEDESILKKAEETHPPSPVRRSLDGYHIDRKPIPPPRRPAANAQNLPLSPDRSTSIRRNASTASVTRKPVATRQNFERPVPKENVRPQPPLFGLRPPGQPQRDGISQPQNINTNVDSRIRWEGVHSSPSSPAYSPALPPRPGQHSDNSGYFNPEGGNSYYRRDMNNSGSRGPPPLTETRADSNAPAITAPRERKPNSDRDVSITLVRRDPSSGSQWNVAQISLVQEAADDYFGISGSKHLSRPIFIEIYNPGYSKFANDPPRLSTNSNRPSLQIDSRQSIDSTRSTNTSGTFSRQVVMEVPDSQDRIFGHRKALSTESTSSPYDSLDNPQIPSSHSRMPSFDRSPLPSPSMPRPKSRGYVFLSPWQGRCVFSTGIAGRSLKCKHRLPPAVAGGTNSPSVTISELRFNLPSSNLLGGKADSKSHPRGRRGHLSLDLSRRRRSGSTPATLFPASNKRANRSSPGSESEDEDLKPMDLSLGQEHAGGGMGGKRAKMGKLIIEDEGLKMLDLTVAANMGVWWCAWERVMRD